MQTEIKAVIQAAAREDESRITVHDAIRAALDSPRWKGKKLTRAFAKTMRAALGYSEKAVVWVGTEYKFDRSYRFKVWGAETAFPSYNDAPNWTLPLNGDASEFDRANTWSGDGAKERQRKRAALSDAQITALAEVAARFQRAAKELEAALDFDGPFEPDRYALEKIAKGGAS
jgi:hypothetical protein